MANGSAHALNARAAAFLLKVVPASLTVATLVGVLSLRVLVSIAISLAVIIIIVRHGREGTGQA